VHNLQAGIVGQGIINSLFQGIGGIILIQPVALALTNSRVAVINLNEGISA